MRVRGRSGSPRSKHWLPRALTSFHVGDDLRRIGGLLVRRLTGRVVRAEPLRRELADVAPPSPSPTGRQLAALPTLREIMETLDGELDLALGALVIAREDDQDLDAEAVLARLDRAADGLRLKVEKAGGARERLAVLNAFVFGDLGIAAEREQPGGRGPRSLEALHLHRVLERRRGHCLGISLLYLALGHRLDLPLYGVALPRHFFVRYETDTEIVNVEMTRRGAEIPDREYADHYGLSREAMDAGIYLANLARREVLVEVLNNRGNYRWERGRIDHALRDLDRATREGSNFARGHTGRAFILLRRGEISEAIEELRLALDLDPSYAPAHLHLGDAYLRAGLLDEAEAAFQQALVVSPRLALARTNLGRILSRGGDLHGALEQHQAAIDLDPQSAQAWNNAGVVLSQLGDVEAAMERFEEARAIDPGFLPPRENLVHLLSQRGSRWRVWWSRRGVIRRYREDLARVPPRASALMGLARFLLECGSQADLEQAAEHAERAAALRPHSPDYLATLAELHYRLGNPPRARRIMARVVDLGPGRLLANAGHYEMLLARYAEAVETALG